MEAYKMAWTTKKRLLTLGYWTAITLLFLYDRSYLIQKIGLGHFLVCTLVRVSLLMSLALFHLYYLIPKFFAAKKYLIYLGSVMLSLCVYVSLQSAYDIYLYGFVIGAINYRNFWHNVSFDFVFTVWYLLLTIAFKLSLDWYDQRQEMARLRIELGQTATLENTAATGDYLFLKSGTKRLKTPVAAVSYIQGLKDYAVIYTDEGKIIVKGTLKTVEDLFPRGHFVRIHKSYLVTNSKIKQIESKSVKLINGEIIPIGRSYKHLLNVL